MVIVILKGGLGNQMFQYAFGRYLSFITGKELCLNVYTYKYGTSNRKYDLDMFILSKHTLCETKDLESITGKSQSMMYQISERFVHFDAELTESIEFISLNHPNIENIDFILSGFWQSFRYFEKISDLILKDFTFINPLFGKWKSLLIDIESSESVMINVRRGDYLHKLDYHGVVSREYISKSIGLIERKVQNPKFFLFSDDVGWCREHFQNYENLLIINEEYYDSKYQYYLQLMSACKHFIISNSTFAWWSVLLSKSKDKIVVAPSSWFSKEEIVTKDIYLSDWIKV